MASTSTAAVADMGIAATTPRRFAEHVQLQSEPSLAVDPKTARAVAGPFAIDDSLRSCTTTLTFLEGHLLDVRARRRKQSLGYWLDLRFVAPEPVVIRQVAWRCLQVALAFALLAVAGFFAPDVFDQPGWRPVTLPAAVILATVTVCTLALAWHRTRETLQFRSLHGGAPLFEITAGLGLRRHAQVFEAEFIRRIERARQEWGQPRTHHLRDEMREHHRLHQLGILSAQQYEAGKRAILGAHG